MPDTAVASTAPDLPAAWRGILQPGEKILWQGHPSSRLHFRASQISTMLFGVVFAGFALFWMIAASQAGGIFWMFGLLHFSIGLMIMAEPVLLASYQRAHSFYTLTNRRAFIGSDFPIVGRKLSSYPITATTKLDLALDKESSIYFARREKRRHFHFGDNRIGFEYIDDVARVFSLMSSIQRGEQS